MNPTTEGNATWLIKPWAGKRESKVGVICRIDDDDDNEIKRFPIAQCDTVHEACERIEQEAISAGRSPAEAHLIARIAAWQHIAESDMEGKIAEGLLIMFKEIKGA